jgi:hypothetical protein
VVCGWGWPGIAFHLTLGSWTRRPCGAALLIEPAILKRISTATLVHPTALMLMLSASLSQLSLIAAHSVCRSAQKMHIIALTPVGLLLLPACTSA